MINFIKNYRINLLSVLVVILSVVVLIQASNSILMFVLEVIIAICFGFIFNFPSLVKLKDEYKMYNVFATASVILIMGCLTIMLIFNQDVSGWDALGIVVLSILMGMLSFDILLVGFLIRVFYRIKMKQKFNFKAFLKNNLILLITLLATIPTSIYIISQI